MGVQASVFRYPLNVRHPAPLDALRAEISRRRAGGTQRIGLIGFSAGGHLAGLAALAPGAAPDETVQFAVLGYAITSMETETYRPARLILLGEDASPQLRRSTSLDALVTSASPPFFVWHTAEDPYVPPEHTYRFASALAASHVPHAVHVFAHGPHSLGLAQDAGEAATWTTLANAWIREQASPPGSR
jgi:acetyl esterase/lipase